VYGRSEGAPPEACGDIVPLHNGISSSDTSLPYLVNLSDFIGDQYIPRDMYTSEK